MKVLSVIGTLDPAYGGPVEALRQLTPVLEEFGNAREIVTLDAPHSPWVSEFPGRVHALGPSLGKYRYTRRLVPWLRQNALNYDAVLVHGIWQFQSLATWRVSRTIGFPYFVFVHGALNPWFRYEYPLKHMKKWLYWPWAEYRVIRDARAVLFTNQEECVLARRSFGLYRATEAVVDYGIQDPAGDPDAERRAFFEAYPALVGKRLLLFMGRLHRVKGLDLLIEAFAQVGERDPRLQLVIAGPDQEGLRASLGARSRTLGMAARITWTGMLTGDVRWGAYRAAEAFCLPSHSENFGIVVAEALARGLPVLISDKVNIWRQIDEDRAGFVAPDTVAGTASLLTRWLDLTGTGRMEMAGRARSCFAARFEIRKAAEKLVSVIERNIGRTGANVGVEPSTAAADRKIL